jgi:arginine decarboxylase
MRSPHTAVPELADAVDAALRLDLAHFAPPGHKRLLGAEFGSNLQTDITLLTGVDDQSLSRELLPRAEVAVASLWEADWARISVHGSSLVNQAVLLGLGCNAGGSVVVARNAHRSVMTGLVLSGLTPIWVLPAVTRSGLIAALPPERVRDALDSRADIQAVMLVEPSYTGAVSDIPAVVELAKLRGVPVVVDQAWGAHFGFHESLPPPALALGADLAVVSMHKTLPSLTQAALLLASSASRADGIRVRSAFDSLLTTSPSGAIYASVDRARYFMATHGHTYLTRALNRAAQLRSALATLPGICCPPADLQAGVTAWQDPLKLTIDVSGTGIDGRRIDAELRLRGVQVSMATSTYLVALLTLADTEASHQRLVDALREITRFGVDRTAVPAEPSILDGLPEVVMPPREAVLGEHTFVRLEEASGRVASEVVAPYPPGIAALVPGERITDHIVSALCAARARHVAMSGCTDPRLAVVRVLSQRA